MERFYCKTRILSGPGAIREVEKLGCRRLVLVSDPYFVKNGTAEKITQLSGAEAVQIFGKVKPDPDLELAAEGTAILKQFRPDTLIALGGGSAMDCAKAMGYFYGEPLQVAAIPTTSGSGSELTDFAVLTHGTGKYPLVEESLQPDVAILDSDLLENLPPALIADTGFDVLSHALEALAATGAGTITDALARDAFCTVYSLLQSSFQGNRAVRMAIHNASAMAGLAFNQAGLGLCHAISHALGGRFHVPHGRLNAILLPEVLSCNAEKAGSKYAALARMAGLGSGAETMAVRNLKNGLVRLRRSLNLPATLLQAGISSQQLQQHLQEIIETAGKDPCCKTNPVPAEGFLIRRILQEVAGHG